MILTSAQGFNVRQYSSKGMEEKIKGGVYQTTLYAWIHFFNEQVVFEYHNSYEDSLKKFIARAISTIPESPLLWAQKPQFLRAILGVQDLRCILGGIVFLWDFF